MTEKRALVPLWKGLPADPHRAAAALLDAWLGGRKSTTLRTYQQSLDNFAEFLNVEGRDQAAAFFLGLKNGGQANKLVLDYRNWMISKYSSSTVSVRMSALKSLSELGRVMGRISWTIEIKAPPVEKYRDTRGPGFERIREALKSLAGLTDPKAMRDRAIMALLGVLGLRRGEAVALDLADLDFEEKRLFYLGKGRSDVEPMTVPDEILAMLRAWIGARGTEPGPLFIHFGRVGKTVRLSDRSVARICHARGVGNPHGLRHSAITQSLDRNNGDVRKTAKFSRHKSMQALMKYDDNRRDEGGEIAKDLAKDL